MPQVIVRMYGRFVFGVQVDHSGAARGPVVAMAVNPGASRSTERRFKDHRLMMTIPRSAVAGKQDKEPDHSLTAGMDIQRAEHAAWDLRGCEITIGAGHTAALFQAPQEIVLPDLAELSPGAELDKNCLRPGAKHGLVSSIVTLQNGFGSPRQVVTEFSNFAPVDDPHHPSPILPHTLLADLVEIVFDDVPPVTIKGPSDPRPVPINIEPVDIYPTMISLSHLCVSTIADIDAEFSTFYDVLKKEPKQRLVPVADARFMEDCYKAAKISYIP